MVPAYTEMDENEIQAILDQYRQAGEDTLLQDERKKEDAFLRNQACPTCGRGGMIPFFVSKTHVFGGNQLLGRCALRCDLCLGEYDPYSRLVLKQGNLLEAQERIKAGQMPGILDRELSPQDVVQIAERVKRHMSG